MRDADIDTVFAADLRAVLAHPPDRTRLVYVERDGEVFVGYTPRNPRGPTPSRAERKRMERFAHYVWEVRRLPFRICCVAPGDGRGTWHPVTDGAAYLPMRAWMLPDGGGSASSSFLDGSGGK